MENQKICEYMMHTGNCVMRKTCPYYHPAPIKLNINAKPFVYKPTTIDPTTIPFSIPVSIPIEPYLYDDEEEEYYH